MAELPDHYAVLGVGPGDDARAVRRAYVAGIRAHPPETDPEGFAAVRRAYEVLSDAEARAAYDEARAGQRPDDPEGEALWGASQRAAEAGDLESARRLLERLVELRPGALGAWHELGEVCLKLGATAPARWAFRRLAEAFPDRHDVQLDLARAARADGDTRAAAAHVARALELAGDALGARIEVADLLLGWRDLAGARGVLEALLQAGGEGPPLPAIVLRLASADLTEGKPKPAAKRVLAAAEAWRAAPEEARGRAGGALSVFALELFEAGREREGRAVLEACRALAPAVAPEVPRPTLVRAAELHPEDLAWLEAQGPAGSTPEGQEAPGLGRWLTAGAVVAVGGLLVLAAMGVLDTRRPWSGWQIRGAAAGLMAAGLLEVELARAAWRRWRGRLAAGAVLDHQHLLLVGFDRVRVLPLHLLRKLSLHVKENGYVKVTAWFCGSSLAESLSFTSRAAAEAFGEALMQRRAAMLRALSEGRAPEGRRAGAWAEPAARRGPWRLRRLGIVLDRWTAWRVAAAGAAAAALVAGGAWRGARADQADRWIKVKRIDQLAEYLKAAAEPSSPYAGEARAAADRILAAAAERWADRSRPGPGAALVAGLLQPGAAAPPAISAAVLRSVDTRELGKGALDPLAALDGAPADGLADALRRALRVGFAAGTNQHQVPAVLAQAADGAPGLILELRLVALPGAYRAGPGRSLGVLAADWTLVARPPGGGDPVLLGEGRVQPPDELPLPRAAWYGADEAAARAGYLAQQRALAVEVLRAAVLATGAPVEAEALEASIGDLGVRLPPPGLAAERKGGRDGR